MTAMAMDEARGRGNTRKTRRADVMHATDIVRRSRLFAAGCDRDAATVVALRGLPGHPQQHVGPSLCFRPPAAQRRAARVSAH